MKSLAERHNERAKRLAENATEARDNPTPSVGFVEAAFREAYTAMARLDPEQQEQLTQRLGNAQADGDFEFGRSLAESPDGSGRTMAGIGVVNTRVVPASVYSAEAGNGGGMNSWDGQGKAGYGETAPVTVEPLAPAAPVDGNLNGAAIQTAVEGATEANEGGAGWDAGEAATPPKRAKNASNG